MMRTMMRKTASLHVVPQPMLLLLHLITLLANCAAAEAGAAAVPISPSDYPTKITLRAGILHAPPFAYVTEQDDGSYEYTGFQPDLLRKIVEFAKQDNVELEILMSPSPPQYNDAFDRVANDCNTTTNPHHLSEEECTEFDMMAANYYATASRSLRAHLSAPILRSTISTIKYIPKSPGTMDFTTLRQAESAGATVCLKDGTFYAGLVKDKYPNANFLMCPNQDECLALLKAEECVLLADDELQIRFKVAWDDTLDVTPEHFNTQYIVWAFKDNLPPLTVRLFEKWMYDANTNAINDDLYSKYFQKALCPVGTAGESCELPCDPKYGEADSKGVCVCISTKFTGNDCSIEVPENINLIPRSMKLLADLMLSINVTIILGCAIWLYLQRQTPQVRGSQPFFLCLVLLGCLISSCTIIVLGQEDEGDGPVPACMAIPWLYSFGFSVTFGTLFAKIRRVYVIFTSSRDARRARPGIISVKETVCVIGAVLAIDVTILIIWTITDPLRWERDIISMDQFGSPLESEGKCYSDHWSTFAGCIAILHLGLMGLACYLSFKARYIPTRFQEGKYVSIAMVSNLQIFVVGVPILIIVGTDPGTSFFVRSAIIWMNDLVVVTLIFGNLIYNVHFEDSNNNGAGTATRDIVSQLGASFQRYSGRSLGLLPKNGSFSTHTATGCAADNNTEDGGGGIVDFGCVEAGGSETGCADDASSLQICITVKKNGSGLPPSSPPQEPSSTAPSSRSNSSLNLLAIMPTIESSELYLSNAPEEEDEDHDDNDVDEEGMKERNDKADDKEKNINEYHGGHDSSGVISC